MKPTIKSLARKKAPAVKRAARVMVERRSMARHVAESIVSLQPTPEMEQRIEALAERVRKAKEAPFLEKYKAVISI